MVLYLVVSPPLLVSLAASLQFSVKKSSLLTPAESTLVDVYQNKSLKPPLESTLTLKRGEGVQARFMPFSPASRLAYTSLTAIVIQFWPLKAHSVQFLRDWLRTSLWKHRDQAG